MAERVVCNKCGVEYTDKKSIEQTKEWTANGYAPCPNLGCSGKLEVKQASTPAQIKKCSNCGCELTNVWAARSVELQKDGDKWIEKHVFSSGVSCTSCHNELSDEEIKELGIEGY